MKYLKNIIEGLIFLNSRKIKIKNLKSTNILIELDGNVKLTDFIDFKSIIEFNEIYESSNFKNLRNSEKFSKNPFPFMLKSNFLNESYFNNNSDKDKVKDQENYSYLSFLMLEMFTGNTNLDYLKENFNFNNEGNFNNDIISSKNFEFPENVSIEFKELFYLFFENTNSSQFENILNHNFFSS